MTEDISELIGDNKLEEGLLALQERGRLVSSGSRIPRGEDTFIRAIILNVKVPKDTAREIKYKKGCKSLAVYHRLYLCRELYSGELFLIISATPAESARLHKFGGQMNGGFVVLFEPKVMGTVYKVPLLASQFPLLPTKVTLGNVSESPLAYVVTSLVNSDLQSFVMLVDRVEIECATLVECCTHEFCDGRHDINEKCPAVGSRGEKRYWTLKVSVTVEENEALTDLPFRSSELAELFVEEDVLKTEERTWEPLRKPVRTIVQHYNNKNTRWMIAGWFKRIETSDENALGPLHISKLYPTKILEVKKVGKKGAADRTITISPMKAGVRLPTFGRVLAAPSTVSQQTGQEETLPPPEQGGSVE